MSMQFWFGFSVGFSALLFVELIGGVIFVVASLRAQARTKAAALAAIRVQKVGDYCKNG